MKRRRHKFSCRSMAVNIEHQVLENSGANDTADSSEIPAAARQTWRQKVASLRTTAYRMYINGLNKIGMEKVWLDYGAIGALLIILLAVARKLANNLYDGHEKNKVRIETLEGQLRHYLEEDRAAMVKVIAECTSAIQANTEVMQRLIPDPDKKVIK